MFTAFVVVHTGANKLTHLAPGAVFGSKWAVYLLRMSIVTALLRQLLTAIIKPSWPLLVSLREP